jgi:CRISPR-associated exonuclease Cas4
VFPLLYQGVSKNRKDKNTQRMKYIKYGTQIEKPSPEKQIGKASYQEEDYIQLSSLQHYLFCPRQCAIAYLEESWIENELTALGRLLHKKVHQEGSEKRKDIIQARSLRLSSAKLGLSGITDLVEFYRCKTGEEGISLSSHSGRWRVFPVEYKLGKPKMDKSDEVQLCAQAICLEEMLQTSILEGAIFYGKKKRRHEVLFNKILRDLTEKVTQEVHHQLKGNITPLAVYEKKCPSCSLIEICMPKQTGEGGQVQTYIKKMITEGL